MDKALIDKLKGCLNQLSPFSDSVQAAMVEMGHQPVNIPAVCGHLELDPVLASAILRLANSPFYGFARKITNVQDAAVLLGMHSLKQLLISFSLVKTFPRRGYSGLDRDALWQHSVAVAVTARILAPRCGLDPDDAFIAGMLHDMGQFILDQCLGEEYGAVLVYCREQDTTLAEAEQALLGMHHGRVAAAAIHQWKLPTVFAEVALYHDDRFEPAPAPLVDLIHLADVLVKGLWISPQNDDRMVNLCPDTLPRLGLSWDQIEERLPEIVAMSDEVIGRLLP